MFHSWESAGDPGFNTVGCWDHFAAVCKAKSSFDSLCGGNVVTMFYSIYGYGSWHTVCTNGGTSGLLSTHGLIALVMARTHTVERLALKGGGGLL